MTHFFLMSWPKRSWPQLTYWSDPIWAEAQTPLCEFGEAESLFCLESDQIGERSVGSCVFKRIWKPETFSRLNPDPGLKCIWTKRWCSASGEWKYFTFLRIFFIQNPFLRLATGLEKASDFSWQDGAWIHGWMLCVVTWLSDLN